MFEICCSVESGDVGELNVCCTIKVMVTLQIVPTVGVLVHFKMHAGVDVVHLRRANPAKEEHAWLSPLYPILFWPDENAVF